MEQIEIRLCGERDVELLALLGRTTFYDTFAAHNTPEDIEQYLSTTFNGAQISTELKDPNVQYYLTTIKEDAAGYLKLNFSAVQTEFQDKQAL